MSAKPSFDEHAVLGRRSFFARLLSALGGSVLLAGLLPQFLRALARFPRKSEESRVIIHSLAVPRSQKGPTSHGE